MYDVLYKDSRGVRQQSDWFELSLSDAHIPCLSLLSNKTKEQKSNFFLLVASSPNQTSKIPWKLNKFYENPFQNFSNIRQKLILNWIKTVDYIFIQRFRNCLFLLKESVQLGKCDSIAESTFAMRGNATLRP